MSQLSPKIWLITGANSGLGLALSEYALFKGDKVIAAARDISRIPISLKEAAHLRMDLDSSDAELKEAAHKALKVYGRVDVLVNNAGYGSNTVVEELSGADMRGHFQVHVFGAIALIQALLPSFRAQKSGQIINLSTFGAFSPVGGFGAYCASKAAIEGFSEALAQEVKSFGIEVLIIQPGFFPTSWSHSAVKTIPATVSEIYKSWYGLAVEEAQVRERQAGDPQKYAARVWEVVHKTGLASEIQFDGTRSALRVQLGSDCGRRAEEFVGIMAENVDRMKPLWSSTDMDEKQVNEWITKKTAI